MSWYSWILGEVPKEGSKKNGSRKMERADTLELEDEISAVKREALGKLRSSRKSLDETLQEIALLKEEAQDIMAEDDQEELKDGE